MKAFAMSHEESKWTLWGSAKWMPEEKKDEELLDSSCESSLPSACASLFVLLNIQHHADQSGAAAWWSWWSHDDLYSPVVVEQLSKSEKANGGEGEKRRGGMCPITVVNCHAPRVVQDVGSMTRYYRTQLLW